ncbi:MAG: NB-ARC domain-containing protein, partial [Fimbriimonadaceae bacterium]
WGAFPLGLRVGIHTGTISPEEGDYLGPPVNLAARIVNLTPEHQVFVSAATHALAPKHPTTTYREVGKFALRGFASEHKLYALVSPHLPPEFPPVYGSDSVPNNLFEDERTFIGRDEERTALRQKILSKQRLITITGMGGIGKSTIARQVAHDVKEHFEGVWFVPCDELSSGEDILAAIGDTMGLRVETSENLYAAIHDRALLIVLDCLEGLVHCSNTIVDLMLKCPRLSLLCTSRVPLSVRREFEFPLGQMGQGKGRGADAVALFEEAVSHVLPDYRIPASERATVRKLCVEILEGIPLAIVLAAGRMRILSLSELVHKVQAERDLVLRDNQQSKHGRMSAVVGASFGALDPAMRSLLIRLTVFRGGFWFDDARAVLMHNDLLDDLTTLKNSSLLIAASALGRARYKILDTVREYLLEYGERGPELDLIVAEDAARFAEQYAKRAEIVHEAELTGKWESFSKEFWLELGNFRRAIAYADLHPRDDLVERFGLSILRTFLVVGLWDDFEHLADRALALAQQTGNLKLEERVLVSKGTLLRRNGIEEEARPIWRRRVDLCLELNDIDGAIDGLTDLVLQAYEVHRPEWGLEPLQAAYRIIRRNRDPDLEAIVFVSRMGYLVASQDSSRFRRKFTKVGRKLGAVRKPDIRLVAFAQVGEMAFAVGLTKESKDLCLRAQRLAIDGDRIYTAVRVLITLSEIERALGDEEAARAILLIAKSAPISASSNQAKRLGKALVKAGSGEEFSVEPWPHSAESMLVTAGY